LIGIDTNILVYALDPTFAEHERAKRALLAIDSRVVNATVIHETYHTLVFRRRMSPADSRTKIAEFLDDRRTGFVNLTRTVCLFALELASRMNLGGRDSLIIGSYLHDKIPEMYSHDEDLVGLGKVAMRGRAIRITDPVK